MDFIRVEAPVFFPCVCVTCNSAEGPFADTLTEKHGLGRIYLCYRCAHESSRKLGGLPPAERKQLEERLDSLTVRLAEAERAREEAVASRVINVDELVAGLRDQSQRSAILSPVLRGVDP